MKFLFRRPVARQEVHHGTIVVKIKRHIRKQQIKAAVWLQLKSEKLSVRTKWILLFLFCITMFGVSVLLIAGKFIHTTSKPSIAITRIKTPVNLEPLKHTTGSISKAEYEKMRAFRIYMDSLARSPGGRKEYEQISKAHPGLLDSIKTIETMYQSQFKN